MMNFLEECRKDAGWPALHRDVPTWGGKKDDRWSITKEALAKFVAAVRSRSLDLLMEIDHLRSKVAKLQDEKAKLQAEAAGYALKLAVYENQRHVKREAESMGLETDQVARLADAVTVDAVKERKSA